MSKKGWEAALESGLKMSGEAGPQQELGWLLIAKYLPRCSDQDKRTLRSRVSSRFTSACQNSCSLKSSLFVRSALAAYPAFKTLYTAQLDVYLEKLLRETQESPSDSLLERATRELWATHANTVRIEKAAAELRAVVSELGKAVEPAGLRAHCGAFLLRLVTDCVRYADKGSTVPSFLLDTLGAAMERNAWRAEALRLLETLVRSASWAVASSAKSLCQSLIRLPPSPEMYDVLNALEETLGASSHIHAHLAIVFNALTHPIPTEFAEEAAKLLGAVIVRSGSLVDPAVLSCVCSAVCAAALRHRAAPVTTRRVYARLLAALLSHGHDAVPVPVHIARALICALPPCSERSQLQLMADSACRPRTYAMAPSLLVEETGRLRKEAAVSRVIRILEAEPAEMANGADEKMERTEVVDATSTETHHKELVEMRETEEGASLEKGYKQLEGEKEVTNVAKKSNIHIQSKKEKKKAAKKRRMEEKAAESAAKKPKTVTSAGETKNPPSPKKKDGEGAKCLTIPKASISHPPPVTADLQAVIDMAVLDFD